MSSGEIKPTPVFEWRTRPIHSSTLCRKLTTLLRFCTLLLILLQFLHSPNSRDLHTKPTTEATCLIAEHSQSPLLFTLKTNFIFTASRNWIFRQCDSLR
ncbi:MAG: hypothetical protein R2807_08850 [Chitinophagales bacterium]